MRFGQPKHVLHTLAFACGILIAASPARPEACKVDTPPAATLLLPYFEVDLSRTDGITTMFSIGNATASATLAHVTLWTDLGVPTLNFNVYLTGWDIETLNVRDLFNGKLPRTASDGQDPTDTISPQGAFSQDIHFASCQGILPLPDKPAALLSHLRAAHIGASSPILNGCSGRALGDNRARGYITVDVVKGCTLLFPSDPGYFGPNGVAASNNVLFGDYFIVDSPQNAARGDELVRIEAFPGRFRPGDPTFYGRFKHGGATNYQAVDDREPLPSKWATRYLKGGVFDGGSSLVVWRDVGVQTTAFACNSVPPPLAHEDVRAFDEEENVELPQTCPILCPPTPVHLNFPAASQRVDIDDITLDSGFGGTGAPISFAFGWLEVQFFNPHQGYVDYGQAWVGVELEAAGRFSLATVATALDTSCSPPAPLQGGL